MKWRCSFLQVTIGIHKYGLELCMGQFRLTIFSIQSGFRVIIRNGHNFCQISLLNLPNKSPNISPHHAWNQTAILTEKIKIFTKNSTAVLWSIKNSGWGYLGYMISCAPLCYIIPLKRVRNFWVPFLSPVKENW